MQMLPSQSVCSARRYLSSPLAQRVLHMERTADGHWLLALGGGAGQPWGRDKHLSGGRAGRKRTELVGDHRVLMGGGSCRPALQGARTARPLRTGWDVETVGAHLPSCKNLSWGVC